MIEVQQEIMCVLLQTLLDKNLITQEIHDKSREKILDTWNWPEYFCYDGEVSYGHTQNPR